MFVVYLNFASCRSRFDWLNRRFLWQHHHTKHLVNLAKAQQTQIGLGLECDGLALLVGPGLCQVTWLLLDNSEQAIAIRQEGAASYGRHESSKTVAF